jgi:hypothetical protein
MYRRIDENGLFIEDVINPEEITEYLISESCQEGFYLPRWDGTEWVEGATQEYIDELNGIVLEPTTEERLEELAVNVNDALLAIMYLAIE